MRQIFSALMLLAVMTAMTAHAEVDETEKQIEKLTPIYECKFSLHKNPMYPKGDGKKLAAIEEPEYVPTAGTRERWNEIWTDIRDEETAKIEKRFNGLDGHLKQMLAKGKGTFRPMTDGDVYSLKEALCTCEENQVAVQKIHEVKKKLLGKKEFRVESEQSLTEKDLNCAGEV